ncbi:MAG: CrcB family protein [Pseudomonadota bacterium]
MTPSFAGFAFVGVGGALGAMARYGLHHWLQRDYPWGTLTANLVGCLLMGVLAQLVVSAPWFSHSGWIPEQHRLLFAVGFCGAFTTLSALVLEMHQFVQRSEWLHATGYALVSVVGGFAFFFAGFMLVRALKAAA